MASCLKCKVKQYKGAKFCPECGTPQQAEPIEAIGNSIPVTAAQSQGQQGGPLPSPMNPRTSQTSASWLDSPGAIVGAAVPAALKKYQGKNPACTFLFTARQDFNRVHVFGSASLKLGRLPERNDITLWVLPLEQSPENSRLTNAISGQHCEILFQSQGLFLKDNSSHGTSLDHVRVAKNTQVPIPVDRVSYLDVFQSMQLRLTPLVQPVKRGCLQPFGRGG